jgi:hypothetical protein
MANWAYFATNALVVDLEFKCKACGFASPVKVEAKGAGYQGGVSSRNDAATERKVAQQASESARRWAEIFVEFCPCPKCGKRDAAVEGYKRKNWIVGGVSAGILVLGGVLAALGIYAAGVPLALIGLIAVIVTPAMALSTLSNAKKKVHFPVEDAVSASSAQH